MEDFTAINHELACFRPDLAQRPQIVVASKMDLPEAQQRLPEMQRLFANQGLGGGADFGGYRCRPGHAGATAGTSTEGGVKQRWEEKPHVTNGGRLVVKVGSGLLRDPGGRATGRRCSAHRPADRQPAR